MTYPTQEPWGGRLYHGRATPGAPLPQAGRVPRRRLSRGALIGGGVAAAVALGLGFGFLARPHLGDPTAPAAPMQPVSPAEAERRMSIEIAAPPPAPVVASAGKLEVLPAGVARSAPAAQPSAMMRLPAPPPLPQLAANSVAAPSEIVPVRPAANSAPCAGSPAAQMVCADPELAGADRAMARAYRRAVRSGADPDQLRAEQRDWLAVREEAARRSRGAVASIYDQRIDELNQLADDGPG